MHGHGRGAPKYVFTDEEMKMSNVDMHLYVKKHRWSDEKIKNLKLFRRRRNNCNYSKTARLRRKMLRDGKKLGKDLESVPELYHIPKLLKVVRVIKIIF